MTASLRSGKEHGVALPLALFALVVMAALVSGSFFLGRLEQQSGRNTLYASQSAEAAEAGLVEGLASLSADTLLALPVGGVPVALGDTSWGTGFRVVRQVSRLTTTLFLLRSVAARQDARGEDLAVRMVGTLLRVVSDSLGGPQRVAPLRQRGWLQLH